MIKNMKKEECTGCNACYNSCPKNAIEMVIDEEGFKYPIIKNEKCIKCGLCEKICPYLNKKSNINNKENMLTFVTYSKDKENRKESSSGGIFSEITRYIIENKKGIVFSPIFDDEFNLIHKKIIDKNGLEKAKGSKYIQSDTQKTYQETKKALEQGKYVLYSGTPCQVAGLKAYLSSEYEKLYTCDIICHGVPSKKVLKKYLNELEKKYKSHVREIYFRDKTYGWNHFSMKVKFENEMEYKAKLTEDVYMQAFLKNLSLRPSCYNCKYSTIPRVADISLGDFWGIEKINKEFNDDKGTSLVLINNDKGKELLDNIKDKIYYSNDCDLDYAIKMNPCICGSVKKPKNRTAFFKKLDDLEMQELIRKYGKTKIKLNDKLLRIASKIKHLVIK